MTTSDVFAIVAIIISLFTLALNSYQQYSKKADVKVLLGDQIRFLYDTNYHSLNFNLNLTLYHAHARSSVIVTLDGNIASTEGNRSSDFSWGFFTESKNMAPPGQSIGFTAICRSS